MLLRQRGAHASLYSEFQFRNKELQRSSYKWSVMKKCANLCKPVERSVLLVLMAVLLGMALPLHSQLSWNRLDIKGPSPEPRRGVGGIFDSENNRVVFQGGESRPDPFPKFFSDTWALDLEAQAWQELNGATPSARCHFSWVTHPQRDLGLLFGGFPRNNELWSYRLSSASWIQTSQGTARPPPRCLQAAALSVDRNEMVVYGGLRGAFTPDLQDTWVYDIDSGQWTKAVSESPPGRRYGSAHVWDQKRQRLVLFGGLIIDSQGTIREADDLWAFDLKARSWKQLTPLNDGPSRRQFARAVALPARDGLILWGGRDSPPTAEGSPEFKNDLWFLGFDPLRWQKIETKGTKPPARFRHTLIRHPVSQRLVLAFGEGKDENHFADVWTLNLEELPIKDESQARLRIQRKGDSVRLSWQRSSGTRSYTIQRSVNLREWQNVEVIKTTAIDGSTDTLSMTVKVAETMKFYRLLLQPRR